MTRKSIGFWTGLGLFAVASCTGGGGVNDFTLGPSDDAPTDPGAPRDRNAPPANPNDPSFGGVAPPPNGEPPGGGTIGGDCTSLCNDAVVACQPDASLEDVAECIDECNELPGQCLALLGVYYGCLIANGCFDEIDACESQLLDVLSCIGPQPPDGGEGGQGGV